MRSVPFTACACMQAGRGTFALSPPPPLALAAPHAVLRRTSLFCCVLLLCVAGRLPWTRAASHASSQVGACVQRTAPHRNKPHVWARMRVCMAWDGGTACLSTTSILIRSVQIMCQLAASVQAQAGMHGPAQLLQC